MNIFQRILKLFQAEANDAIDKLEDPVKMSEQGLRDLKNDLEKSLRALAEVKAMAIRAKRDAETYANQAADYEQKAIALIRKAEQGELSPEEADRLADAALTKKAEAEAQRKRSLQDYERFDQNVNKLDAAVKKLRADVSKFENEIKTLKARAKVSAATQRVNKQLAGIDSTSTVAMLERMKERVDQQEAESDAYAEIANESRSVDDEIEKALGKTSTTTTQSAALSALKAKMNQGIEAPRNNPASSDALSQLKSQLMEEKEIQSDRVDDSPSNDIK